MALSTAFDPVFAQHLAELEKRALAAGVPTHLISGVRTRQDQEELYANFLAGQKGEPLPYPARGAVPMAAPPGSSKHEKGFAADLVADDPSQQAKLIALGASDPYFRTIKGDPSHFEATDGSSSSGAVSTGGVNSSARGMRNNNPGNLVANAWTATLPGYKGSDGKFAIFDTLENGAAALDRNLASYGSKGIHTPLAIASTWAPAGDNNDPNSYGATIAKALGVGPNDTVDMNDPKVRAKVAEAITKVENGPGDAPPPSAVASGQPTQPAPDDWQKLLGAEGPPAPPDLGSIMGEAAQPMGLGGVGNAGVSNFSDEEAPPVELPPFAAASAAPEDLGARYAASKPARRAMAPLADLFTIKTIGQPASMRPPTRFT